APRTGAAATIIATAASPADVEVARVNGRPVWGSCVTAQAAAGADRATALDECVAFELLAQAAEERGLAVAPEVLEATKTALVDRVVQTGFEARYRTPADLADRIDKIIARNRDQMERPEGRASTFARIELPREAPPEQEAQARQLAEQIARELADEPGLFPSHLEATAKRVTEGSGVKLAVMPVAINAASQLVAPYAAALFALPDVGRVSKPVRTNWGWDVILLTDIVPPRRFSPEEVARDVFPEVRRSYFQVWVNEIAKALGVTIEIDPAQVARLAEDE
nr:peptidyl-prolyl cis-trans isomerase [Myxococcota bacterium]